jgi:hypothetical protein
MLPKRAVLKRLVNTPVPHMPPAVIAFVYDALDNANRMERQLDVARSVIEAALDTYNIRVRLPFFLFCRWCFHTTRC